jgi:CRP-like cAMP-binding protein
MTIEDDIVFFERVPTLGLLGRDALRILAIGAESRYVHGGEVLFAMGDQAETTRPATATALEPSTVLRIPRGLFLKMLDGYPGAAEKLREILTTRCDQSASDIYTVRGLLDANRPD